MKTSTVSQLWFFTELCFIVLACIGSFISFTHVIFVLDGEFKLLYEPFYHFPVPRHHGLVEWRKSGPVGRQDVLLPVQQLFDVTQVLGLYRLVQFCHFSLSMHDYTDIVYVILPSKLHICMQACRDFLFLMRLETTKFIKASYFFEETIKEISSYHQLWLSIYFQRIFDSLQDLQECRNVCIGTYLGLSDIGDKLGQLGGHVSCLFDTHRPKHPPWQQELL